EDGIRDGHVTGVQTCALPISFLLGQPRDAVVRAADLEAEDRLRVLALQQHLVVEAPREPRRGIERCLADDLVDAACENLPKQGRSEERRVGKGWRYRWAEVVE